MDNKNNLYDSNGDNKTEETSFTENVYGEKKDYSESADFNNESAGFNNEASDIIDVQATETVVEEVASASTDENTTYRYDRSYYETHKDENTSYHYNNIENQQANQQSSYQYQNANATSYEEDPKEKKKCERKMKKANRKSNGMAVKVARSVAGLVLVAAVSVASTYASLQIFGSDSDNVVIQATSTDGTGINKVASTSTGGSVITTDVSSVVKEVMPSVVSISNIGTQTITGFFGQSSTYQSESSGSGIIMGQNEKELLIVTNQHVISGADTINVTFIDAETYVANVKGSDNKLDLAVIAIELSELKAETLDQIKVATIGDSDKLSVGEPAIAIGNALGYGQSVTTGVISALNREVTIENVTSTLIQTDAAINPGNSGGALMNLKGEIVGINSVKYASTEVEGMGYAIPISDVTDVINEMMSGETKKKVEESGYLGITCADVTSSVSQMYNMPEGVYVAQVEEDGPAEKAGLKKGDIITKIENTTISSTEDLTAELEYYEPNTTIKVVVQSQINNGYGYEEKIIEVTLGKRPN